MGITSSPDCVSSTLPLSLLLDLGDIRRLKIIKRNVESFFNRKGKAISVEPIAYRVENGLTIFKEPATLIAVD